MTRVFGMVAFGLIVVAQTCSTEDCGRNKDCKIDVVTTVSPGQTVDIGRTVSDAAQCSTCDHAVLKAKWTLQNFDNVTGSVRLSFLGSCTEAPPLQGITRNQAPSDGSAEIDHNVKNFCPDIANWGAELTNNSNVRLTLNSLTIDCPRKVTESLFNRLGPSRVR